MTETELITCAHVVAEATGTDPEATEPPGGLVAVDLPFLGVGPLDAHVIAWRPVGAEFPEDIAVLRLVEEAPEPGARPARLLAPALLAGRSFEVCGFPQGNDAGAWAEGRTGHRRSDGTLQVGDPNETGYAIQPGFSGAPVWDVLARGVIGMVVARERQGETKVAFVLPIDRLNDVWPLKVTEAHDPFAHLTAGVHDSLSGLRQLLAEYVGLPGMTHAFGGRGRSFDALDRWVEGPTPYALMVVPAGRGKTALLSRWASALAALGTADVVFVPVSVRFGTASHAPALRLLLERLRYVLQAAGDFVADPTTWHSEAERLLEEAPADATRRLLVIFDGVDEAAGWSFHRELRFPVPSPDGLKVIVSARQTADRDAEDWVDRLHWRGLAEFFDLDPLDRRGVEEVITSIGIGGDDPRPLADALWRLTGGDPLELQLYARQLQARRSDSAIDISSLSERAPGLEGFFELWWEDQVALWAEQGRDDLAESEEDINRLLGFAAMALGALDYEDFAALGGGRLRQGVYLQRKLSELGRFLIPAAHREGEGGLVLAHPRLNLFFASEPRMLQAEREDFERQLFEYCRSMLLQARARARARVSEAGMRMSAYAVRYLGVHAEGVYGDSETLYELIDPAWYGVWQAFEGAAEGFLGDVDRARRRAEAETEAAGNGERCRTPVRMQVRCALVVSSLTSQAESLEPGLIAALLQAQVWTPQIAMEYALRPNSDQARVDRLAALFGLLPPRQRAEALAAVAGAPWSVARPALIDLSKSLTDQELREVSAEHTDAIFDSVVLAEQARRSAGAEQQNLASAALASILTTDDRQGGWALANLADLLRPERRSNLAFTHPELYLEALRAADDVGTLVADVPIEMIPVLAGIAVRDHSFPPRVTFVGRLLARLPADQRQQLIDSATAEAGFSRGEIRSSILNGLAAAVAEGEFEHVTAQALDEAIAAGKGKYSMYLNSFLKVIGPRLPAPLARRVLDAVESLDPVSADSWLILARAAPSQMTSDNWQSALDAVLGQRGRPLVFQLLALVPDADRNPVLQAAVSKLETTFNGWSLGLLTEFLPPELRSRAVQAARAAEPAMQRAWALAGLARSAGGEEQRELLRETLTAAQLASGTEPAAQRAQDLLGLARRVDDEEQRELLREALTAANTVDDAQQVLVTLGNLADELDQETLERLREYAFRPANKHLALTTPTLARHLRPEQARQLLGSVMEESDETAFAGYPYRYGAMERVLALAEPLSGDVIRGLLQEVDQATHSLLDLGLLAALLHKGDLTALERARGFLSRLTQNPAYPSLFWEFYWQLPLAHKASFAGEALAYVRDIERYLPAEGPGSLNRRNPDEERARLLPSIAKDAPIEVQLAVLATTQTITDIGQRASALMGVSGTLTGEAVAAALDLALALPEECLGAQVISGLGDRLHGPTLARTQQAVAGSTDSLARLMGRTALIEHLPPGRRAETARDVVRTAATFAPPSGSSFSMQGVSRPGVLPLDDVLIHRIVVAVLPSLPSDERSEALAIGQRWIEALPEDWHASILNETVSCLCYQDLLEEAESVARQIPDMAENRLQSFNVGRPEALTTVAGASGRPDLTVEAFEALLTVPLKRDSFGETDDRLARVLAQLMPSLLELTPELLGPLLQRLLRYAAQSGRHMLLPILGTIAPAIARLTSKEGTSDLAREILDVAEWLP